MASVEPSPSTQALRGIAILLLLQAAGEGIARGFGLPFPGPVVGLVLLLPALAFEPLRLPVGAAANVLLSHLSLLFVPIGVGVITHLSIMSEYSVRLIVVIVVSTWVGMATTALALQAFARKSEKREVERG